MARYPNIVSNGLYLVGRLIQYFATFLVILLCQ